jgi:hypothetical protein
MFGVSGPKQQRKFKRLMLNRIKWNEGKKQTKAGGQWIFDPSIAL